MLTKKDRCDRCGAAAVVQFSHMANNTDLLFCGHHATKFMDAITSQGFVVIEDDLVDA